MNPAVFVVVLDANVIFPQALRDILFLAAEHNLYQARWSETILDEALRNLARSKRISDNDKINKLRATIYRAFPEALVTEYEHLIPVMQNDLKDRHVAAAAVHCGAQAIVTQNLKNFRNLPPHIQIQSPDDFLMNICDMYPEKMISILREMSAKCRHPPVTVDGLLSILRKTRVTKFVDQIQLLLSKKNNQ
jgi:predicted nucleic acid-binding protein